MMKYMILLMMLVVLLAAGCHKRSSIPDVSRTHPAYPDARAAPEHTLAEILEIEERN